MLVMMKRKSGTETVAINAQRVRWIEPVADTGSRIFFAKDESVVVDGAVEQAVIALATVG